MPAKPQTGRRKSVTRKPASSRKRKRKAVKRKSKAQPLLIRTSERSTFGRCRQQWEWAYVNTLAPIREQPALKFGTMIHSALELRYPPGIKRGPKPAESFEKIFLAEQKQVEAKWKMKVEESWEDALGLGIEMMEAFIEHYGRDEDWKVIESEMTFQVPVYMPQDYDSPLVGILHKAGFITIQQVLGKEPLFFYVGTMDGVWENRIDAGIRVNDWKTTSGDPKKDAMGKAVLDDQTTAYWTWGVDWLVQEKILKPRQLESLDGMLFTFLRKAKRDERVQNSEGLYLNLPTKKEQKEFGDDYPGSVSKKQPPPLFHREVVYRSEIEQERARHRAVQEVLEMIAVRAGILPVYKTTGTGYPTQQCQACSFRDMCELHEGGADWELMRDSSMQKWDPYSAHEIKEEGKY